MENYEYIPNFKKKWILVPGTLKVLIDWLTVLKR